MQSTAVKVAEMKDAKEEKSPPPALKYHDFVNPDTLRMIPRDAKVVMEVGCGTGALGERYKQENPFCHYIGVEISEAAAEFARERLDHVAVGNVEEMDPAVLDLGGRKIDCILYGDVLEHLNNPWKLLREHADILSDDGIIIACIPNVQHWNILYDLFKGKWTYEPNGLLDWTHLRFFTLDEVFRLFSQANLDAFDVQPRRFVNYGADKRMKHEEFMKLVMPVAQKLGVDPKKFDMQTGALQYVVRASKKKRAEKPLAIHSMILKPVGACNDVRIDEPNAFLATIPHVSIFSDVSGADLKKSKHFKEKVFIYQRPIIRRELVPSLKNVIKHGYLFVVEFDDYPDKWPEIAENDFLNFTACHAIQTSTLELAEYLKKYNPNVEVFPNQLAKLPLKREYKDGEPVRIFFGALNREEDWLPLMPKLNEIAAKYGDKVFFEVVHDSKFFDALETPHKNFTPLCVYRMFMEIMGKCDINLLPLGDNLFNSMKSDLKFIESCGSGAVALASPVVYEKSLKDGQTGVIFRNPEEFGVKLDELVSGGKQRREIAGRAYEYAKNERMQCSHYRKRYEWYQSLIARLPELNEQLRKRVPVMVEG